MKLYGAVDEEQKAGLRVGTRVRVGKRVVVALGLGFVLAAAYAGVATLGPRGAAVEQMEEDTRETPKASPLYVAAPGTTCCQDDTPDTCADDDSDAKICIDAHSDPDNVHYYCCCSSGQKLKPPFEMPELILGPGGCPVPNITYPPSMSPPANRTLYDVISADAELSTLKGLIDTANIQPLFMGTGMTPMNMTVFAPSDAAFAELAPGVLDELRADIVKLDALLMYHLLPQKLYTLDLQVGLGYPTLHAGEDIAYTSFHMLNGRAGLIKPMNQEASNGVLHTIDAVLTKYLDATEEPNGGDDWFYSS